MFNHKKFFFENTQREGQLQKVGHVIFWRMVTPILFGALFFSSLDMTQPTETGLCADDPPFLKWDGSFKQ